MVIAQEGVEQFKKDGFEIIIVDTRYVYTYVYLCCVCPSQVGMLHFYKTIKEGGEGGGEMEREEGRRGRRGEEGGGEEREEVHVDVNTSFELCSVPCEVYDPYLSEYC